MLGAIENGPCSKSLPLPVANRFSQLPTRKSDRVCAVVKEGHAFLMVHAFPVRIGGGWRSTVFKSGARLPICSWQPVGA